MKRKPEQWRQMFCPLCAILHARAILIDFKRDSRKCHVCGWTVRQLNEHEFSESEMELIERVWAKTGQFPPIQDTKYRVPIRFQEHIKQYMQNRDYVFWAWLSRILSDAEEYRKFRAFCEVDRKRRESTNGK